MSKILPLRLVLHAQDLADVTKEVVIETLAKYKASLHRLKEHRAEMVNRVAETDVLIADGEKLISEMEAKYNVS